MIPALFDSLDLLYLAKDNYERTGSAWLAVVAPEKLSCMAEVFLASNYHLEDVCGLDTIEGAVSVYHFDHFDSPARITVLSVAPHEKPVFASIAPVYHGAEWHERETRDFFGFIYEGNPNFVPLLLAEDMADVHPLCKKESARSSLRTLFGADNRGAELLKKDDAFTLLDDPKAAEKSEVEAAAAAPVAASPATSPSVAPAPAAAPAVVAPAEEKPTAQPEAAPELPTAATQAVQADAAPLEGPALQATPAQTADAAPEVPSVSDAPAISQESIPADQPAAPAQEATATAETPVPAATPAVEKSVSKDAGSAPAPGGDSAASEPQKSTDSAAPNTAPAQEKALDAPKPQAPKAHSKKAPSKGKSGKGGKR